MIKKTVLAIAALAALALGGAALAGATSGGDGPEAGDETTQVSEQTATRAREAALAETGGGEAGHVEADDENGATYEVEVVRPDGTQVDVRLDERFQTVVVESDEDDETGEHDD